MADEQVLPEIWAKPGGCCGWGWLLPEHVWLGPLPCLQVCCPTVGVFAFFGFDPSGCMMFAVFGFHSFVFIYVVAVVVFLFLVRRVFLVLRFRVFTMFF